MCVLALLFACRDPAPEPEAEPAPPTAIQGAGTSSPRPRREIVEELREDARAARHPSDGSGRAWLEDEDARAVAGTFGRWRVHYEAGPMGVAEGGAVYLLVSPYWHWSAPQTVSPEYAGYTEVRTGASNVVLKTETWDRLLAAKVEGRALKPGEVVTFEYGLGETARADAFAEHGEHFWVSVDGDGDGVRGVVEASPPVDVAPDEPVDIVVVAPSTAVAGTPVRVTVSLLDRSSNAGIPYKGLVSLRVEGGSGPGTVALVRGSGSVTVVPGDGVTFVEATSPFVARSNPIVADGGARVLWADLHGHSNFSDGTGTPEDYFAYARDVANLDVAALTDHDHWGVLPLVTHEAIWAEIVSQAHAFDEPGRFVAVAGYEWTSWIHGHRHVLFFGEERPLCDSIAPECESPQDLWRGLYGSDAIVVPHHPAGGPIPMNWDVVPDPELEPVVEVASVHGSSEAADTPRPIYAAEPGCWVRDALGRGYRFGMIGSGDSHDGHPGLAHRVGGSGGGLAAILAEEVTRGAVLEALRARRVYATNGPRILLRVHVGGRPMGSVLPAGEHVATVRAVAPQRVRRIELVQDGRVEEWVACDGYECGRSGTIRGASGGYAYFRILQEDGGAAWSSPVFFD